MRLSQYFIPTLREVPSDAEVISHILMLRAGMIRKLAGGIYSYLPYGYAAHRKVKAIVREEMNRAGALEIFMPYAQPAELWQESGRWDFYGKELLRFKDRHNSDYCLGPTHEEVITDIVRRDIRSYRDLPLNMYQLQEKFRDEIRPRFGLMRGREFCMKDAYSFDVDPEASAGSYEKMRVAYNRIFSRMGLDYKMVEADSGAIGGSYSHEFMVLAQTGEDAVVACTECDYGANIERAPVVTEMIPTGAAAEPPKAMEKIHTPDVKTIDALVKFTGRPATDMAKIVIFSTDVGPVAAFVRGDHEVNMIKVQRLVGAEVIEMADPEEVLRLTGAHAGSCGIVGISEKVKLVADKALENMNNLICGANEDDYHLLNVNPGRDSAVPRYADIRNIQEGDACPKCGGPLQFLRGIEVGHIFRLGTKYSEAMGATYLDPDGKAKPIVMGCYGIGIDRTLAAALEQNHDKDGAILPVPLAPFPALIIPAGKDEAVAQAAISLHDELQAKGVDTLLDDRAARPGVKFKDADLIGAPYRITVGRDLAEGLVEFKDRREDKPVKVPVNEVAAKTAGLVAEALKH